MHLCASLLCIMCHPYVPAFYSHLMLGCACTCNLKSFRHRCLEAIAVQSSFWLWLCCPVPTQRTEMSGGGRPRGSVGPKKRQQEADADDPTRREPRGKNISSTVIFMSRTEALRQFTVQTWNSVMPLPERLWMRGPWLRRRHLYLSKYTMTLLSLHSSSSSNSSSSSSM